MLRPSPSRESLELAFRLDENRTQRQSDGTVSIEGRRFEVPSQCRQLKRVRVRYARWNLSLVTLSDPRTGLDLCRLYPQDKAKNASGIRRTLERPIPIDHAKAAESAPAIPPLLQKLLDEQEKSGLPPLYIPKMDEQKTE